MFIFPLIVSALGKNCRWLQPDFSSNPYSQSNFENDFVSSNLPPQQIHHANPQKKFHSRPEGQICGSKHDKRTYLIGKVFFFHIILRISLKMGIRSFFLNRRLQKRCFVWGEILVS